MTRDLDRRNLIRMAALISDGGCPKPHNLEAMLRAGRDQLVPGELLNYLADLLYGNKNGRPTKSKIQKEMDAWLRAEKLVAEIEAHRRSGCSLAQACAAYARAKGGKATKTSIERQYWEALKIVRDDDANKQLMKEAVQLFGVDEVDIMLAEK